MFKVRNKNTRTTSVMSSQNTSLMSPWYFYCSLKTCFPHFPSVSIVDFEQVNVCWDIAR